MNTPEQRAAYIEGLRQLADALEACPEIELPVDGSILPLGLNFWGDDARPRMAAAARALPCSWDKNADSDYLRLRGKIAGLKVELAADRDTVCTRRVVGVEDREVEEVVTPAVTRKVVKPVEVVEWDCGPILRPEPEPPAGPARCDADWGNATSTQRCTLIAGHEGNHIDAIGHAWGSLALAPEGAP